MCKNGMASVDDALPDVGDTVLCVASLWRYGEKVSTEMVLATYIGFNEAIGRPMFSVETGDEAYALVECWKKVHPCGHPASALRCSDEGTCYCADCEREARIESGQTLRGNILDFSEGIICHQVNCQRVAGAGLALQVRQKWPEWYLSFRLRSPKLGMVGVYQAGDSLFIADLYAQDEIGRGKRRTNYAALGACMMKVAELASDYGLPVYVPYKMGCGLGGGDWDIVKEIVSDALSGYQYAVVKLW